MISFIDHKYWVKNSEQYTMFEIIIIIISSTFSKEECIWTGFEIHSELLIIYLIMPLELALWTCPLTLTYYRKCSLPGVDEVSSKILFVVLSVFIYAFTNLHLYEYLMSYCIQGWYMIKFEIVQTQKHIHFSVTIDCWILCVLNKLSFKFDHLHHNMQVIFNIVV